MSTTSGTPSFAITKAFLGGDPVTNLRPTNEAFAAAEYVELTDDEKLHRPSFEAMPSGVSLSPKALGVVGIDLASAVVAALYWRSATR